MCINSWWWILRGSKQKTNKPTTTKKPTIKINKTKILMNNAVRPFSAVSPALHPSIRLVFFTFNYTLFFPLSLMFFHTYPPSFAARAQLTLSFRATVRKPCCNSENYFHLRFHCSHLSILSLLFRILYQCFPSLRIYLPFFDLFRWPTFIFLISSRTFSQSICLAIDVNQQSARYSYFSLLMFMCPQRPLYVARGKILNKSIINNFLLVRIFFHVHKFISSFPAHVYFYLPLSIICIFRLPFSDHAVVIFPQPYRIHVRFWSNAVRLHQTHWNRVANLFWWSLWTSRKNRENSCRVSHHDWQKSSL